MSPSKPVAEYKVIGTRVPRVDVPDKISGQYTYVHNVRIPGMQHGRVVRPRGQGPFGTGAPIVSVDEKSIAHIPGAKVLRQGDFLAVVAPKEYDAIQAAAQLKVTWKESPMLPTSGNLFGKMRADDTAGNAKAAFRTNTGNVEAALKSAATTVSQSYSYHYGGRAVIGPSCAVADVRANSATIYSSSQNLLGTVTAVVAADGHPGAERARVLLRGRELVRVGPERVGVVQGRGAHVEAGGRAGAHAADALGRARLGLLPGRPADRRRVPGSTRAASSSRGTSR